MTHFMGLQKGLCKAGSTGRDEVKLLLQLYTLLSIMEAIKEHIDVGNVISKSVKPQRVIKKEMLIAVCIRFS